MADRVPGRAGRPSVLEPLARPCRKGIKGGRTTPQGTSCPCPSHGCPQAASIDASRHQPRRSLSLAGAANWQEVFEAPETLDPEIAPISAPRMPISTRSSACRRRRCAKTIFKEIRGRIKEDDSGIPTPDGPFAYNSRMEEGKQYPVLVRTPRAGGVETVLLDCNIEAGDGYFGFGGAEHDPRIAGWPGSPTARARNPTPSGCAIGDRQGHRGGRSKRWPRTSSGSPTAAVSYYVEYDDSHRPFRVMRHRLGTAQAEDELIYEEADKGFFVGVGETLSRSHIVIDVHDHQTSEVHLIDNQAGGAPHSGGGAGRRTGIRRRGARRRALHPDQRQGGRDFKVVTAPVGAAEAAN